MDWACEHHALLCQEVLFMEPYKLKNGIREGKLPPKHCCSSESNRQAQFQSRPQTSM